MSTLSVVIATFAFFTIAIGVMTVGLWFGRSPIKGSCGGLSAMQGETCSICGGKPEACENKEGSSAGVKAAIKDINAVSLMQK